MRVNAVVVAAGEGRRMGGEVGKPFLEIGGQPLIVHTLRRFAESQTVRKIILVTSEKDLSRCEELIRAAPELHGLDCDFQSGGLRRQDSVMHGLAKLDADCEIVVVHDGVRPLISPRLIDRCVEAAFEGGAVVTGVPVRDTTKFVSPEGQVRGTLPRETLWEIQTPQAFRVDILLEAYRRAFREGVEATDDATLVERLGKPVSVLAGERTNLKVTFPEDLIFAEALLREGKIL